MGVSVGCFSGVMHRADAYAMGDRWMRLTFWQIWGLEEGKVASRFHSQVTAEPYKATCNRTRWHEAVVKGRDNYPIAPNSSILHGVTHVTYQQVWLLPRRTFAADARARARAQARVPEMRWIRTGASGWGG